MGRGCWLCHTFCVVYLDGVPFSALASVHSSVTMQRTPARTKPDSVTRGVLHTLVGEPNLCNMLLLSTKPPSLPFFFAMHVVT